MNPRQLLHEHKIEPRRSLGQNFLHDSNTLDKIVEAASLTPDDVVLEIGAGTGALTERLAKTARQVFSVEVDERLKPVLDTVLKSHPNVEMIYQDILTVNLAKIIPKPYVVVANVPYYITSAILKYLLEIEHRPQRLVLTMQAEVAERLVATPNDMSILTVSVQFFGQPHIAMRVKPTVFWPRPEVDSAVVVIDTYEKPPVDVVDQKLYFRVVRAGFGQKRKQLKNSISSGLHLNSDQTAAVFAAAKIDSSRRAETLTLEEWARLTEAAATVL